MLSNNSTISTQVVIIGSSLSGLISAYELGKKGIEVYVLERESDFGGHSRSDIGGINLVNTISQRVRGIEDNPAKFTKDITSAGRGTNDLPHVNYLVQAADPNLHTSSYVPSSTTSAITSATMLDDEEVSIAPWLLREFGINALTKVVSTGGHSVPRTHLPLEIHDDSMTTNISLSLPQMLLKEVLLRLRGMSSVFLISRANAISLNWPPTPMTTKSSESIAGIEAVFEGMDHTSEQRRTTTLITAHSAVIIATGSFLGDHSGRSLLASVSASCCGQAVTNDAAQSNDGGGIKMVRALGGNVIDLAVLHYKSCGIIDPKRPSVLSKQVCPYVTLSAGALLINQQGSRFCNELGLTHSIVDSIRMHCHIHDARLNSGHEQYTAFLLLNKSVLKKLDHATAGLLKPDATSSTCVYYANAFDFCADSGIPSSALMLTMASYNSCEDGCSDSFGRTCFPVRDFNFAHPLCVVMVTPVLSHSLGGLQVNLFSQVLTTTSQGHLEPLALGSIFAVGRAAATTVSGFDILDGNELLETISYGRRAGLRIISSIKSNCNCEELNFQEHYVPMKLLYKEVFDPLRKFSHMHHSLSTPTSTTLHAEKMSAYGAMAAVNVQPFCNSLNASSGRLKPPEVDKSAEGIENNDEGAAAETQISPEPALNVLCFALPSTSSELNIGPGEGLSLRVVVNNAEVVRQYTPVNQHSRGVVLLYLRTRPEHGSMSQYLHYLQPGDFIDIKGPVALEKGDEQRQAIDEWRHHMFPPRLVLIAAGAGIIPFIHLLEALVEQRQETVTEVLLFWIVENTCDLMLKCHLDSLTMDANHLKIVYCVTEPHSLPESTKHVHMGGITSDLLLKHLLPHFGPDQPSSSVKIMLCGGKVMQVHVSSLLETLGYVTRDTVTTAAATQVSSEKQKEVVVGEKDGTHHFDHHRHKHCRQERQVYIYA